MTIYGLIGILMILSGAAVTLGVVLHDLMKPTKPKPDHLEAWHPMLVRHGNLVESEETL